MIQKINTAIFSAFVYCISATLVFAQSAALLPNAMQVFLDANGNPLSGGTVGFYFPSTLNLKPIWQNANESIVYTNPVTLNAAGQPPSATGIYGQGAYRQIVKDILGNTIWDALTSSTGAGGGSAATGDGDLVGTVKPWAGIIAPNQYQFTYGQQLSRTTFAALFTAITQSTAVTCTSSSNTLSGIADTTQIRVAAPVELTCVPPGTTVSSKTSSTIVMSNPSTVSLNTTAVFFPFGNGDGSTTFTLPDFRGNVIAGRPNMGGTLSTVLNLCLDSPAQGGVCGAQSETLVQSQLPNITYTPVFSGSVVHLGTINSNQNNVIQTGGAPALGASANASAATISITIPDFTPAGTINPFQLNGSVTQTVVPTIQPTITLNYIIKVTPDTNSAIATGVTDINGMIGSIACGSGLSCTGNVISVGAAQCNTPGAFLIYNGSLSSTACSTTFQTGTAATLNGAPLTINASGYALQPTVASQTSVLKMSGGQDSVNQGETIAEFDTYGANAQGTILFNKSGGGCLCTGSISGNVLTISGVTFGTLAVGQIVGVIGGTIPLGTTIQSLGTGTGGLGTYNLTASGSASPGATIRSNDTPTNPTKVVNGEFLGVIESAGWYINGSTPTRTNQTAMINFLSDGGDFSSTSWPTSIQFLTTPVGSITPGNPTASGDIVNPHQQFVVSSAGYIMQQFDNIAGGLSDGFIIRNTTLATAIAPIQDSPSIHLLGSGWKTNATAASQVVDGLITLAPAQGTAAPTGTIAFAMQVNAAGYTNQASISSGGVFNTRTGYTLNGLAPSGHVLRGNGTNYIDGQLSCGDLSNSASGCSVTPGRIQFIARAVNFNSANTDNSIAITLPAGITNYTIPTVQIANASASISTATWGLFSAATGGGTAIFGAGQTITVTTASANTNNNTMLVAPTTFSATQSVNFTTLFFRIGTAQGAPATADVIITVVPL